MTFELLQSILVLVQPQERYIEVHIIMSKIRKKNKLTTKWFPHGIIADVKLRGFWSGEVYQGTDIE